MDNIDLSFIIPVYNAEKYIGALIDELLKITSINIEVILVNDGSNDNSQMIIERREDVRLILINQKNQGVSAARNNGGEVAKGSYIAFLDADDMIYADFYNDFGKHIKKDPQVVMLGYKELRDGNEVGSILPPVEEGIYVGSHVSRELITKLIDSKYSINHHSTYIGGKVYQYIIKREYYNSHNIRFNKTMAFAEDLVFVVSMLLNCSQILILHEFAYIYNIIPNTASHRFRLEYPLEMNRVYFELESLCNNIYKNDQEIRSRLEILKFGYLKNSLRHYARYFYKGNNQISRLKKAFPPSEMHRIIAASDFTDWGRVEKLENWFVKLGAYRVLLLKYVMDQFFMSIRSRIRS